MSWRMPVTLKKREWFHSQVCSMLEIYVMDSMVTLEEQSHVWWRSSNAVMPKKVQVWEMQSSPRAEMPQSVCRQQQYNNIRGGSKDHTRIRGPHLQLWLSPSEPWPLTSRCWRFCERGWWRQIVGGVEIPHIHLPMQQICLVWSTDTGLAAWSFNPRRCPQVQMESVCWS